MKKDYNPPIWAKELTLQPSHRFHLGHHPTQIHKWTPKGLDNYHFWLKRDDCTGMALGGNKIRKLEFLLADALQKGATHVITCGGIQSNHCRSTAVAARRVGLEPHILLRTQEPNEDPGLVGNLMLDRMVDAQIHLINHEQYKERSHYLQKVAEKLRQQGHKPYIIPEGGSNGLGSWGYIEAVNEILEQLHSQKQEIDDIVVACGSGGTAAGISLGIKLSQYPAKVHAINVCDDADYFYGVIQRIFSELGSSYEPEEVLSIIDGYKGLGYAKSTQEELNLFLRLSKETGIFFDPVYTGKAMFGLLKELKSRPEQFKGNRILFIHTGGLFGLYDKIDQIAPLMSKAQCTTLEIDHPKAKR